MGASVIRDHEPTTNTPLAAWWVDIKFQPDLRWIKNIAMQAGHLAPSNILLRPGAGRSRFS